MMTVSELIEALQEEDGERIVIMASDAEGNNYSPLYSLWVGAYAPTTTYYGEAGLEELTPEDMKDGYSEEDVVRGEKALILTPTN